uniref:Uncharacterized protein n=1 Tax=Heterorhabditis bacteriophora TaxID=37862 RepID=A0A1I7W7Z9_HETBA
MLFHFLKRNVQSIHVLSASHVDKQTEACIAIMWLMFDL